MLTDAPPAAWLSEATAGALRPLLFNLFGRSAVLLPTPALTGRHLWKLTRDPDAYAPLDEATQRLIRATSGQGRVQVTAPATPAIPGFYVMDMRFAYAASLQSLPCGEMRHETGDALPWHRFQKGRYRIEFTVPAGWDHVGVFMVKNPGGDGWIYPDRPGQTAETWCGNAELALADDMGWPFTVREAITFTGPGRGTPGPLDVWGDRLLRIAALAPEPRAREIRAAIRAIILHTIGAFHGSYRRETVIVKAADAHLLPDDPGVFVRADGNYQYTRYAPLPEHLRIYSHPEWSSEIWSRCRARLLRYKRRRDNKTTDQWGALTVPRETVLGFRTDALYLSRDPGWPDYGELGNFRVKGAITDARPTPRTLAQLHALKEEAESDATDD